MYTFLHLGCSKYLGKKSKTSFVPKGQAFTMGNDDALPATRGGRKMKLSFKAGSLKSDVTVGVAEVDVSDISSMRKPAGFEKSAVKGPIVALTPHGTVFDECVDIEIPYDTPIRNVTLMKAASFEAAEFISLDNATHVNHGDGTSTATTCLFSFSVVAVFESLAPAPTPNDCEWGAWSEWSTCYQNAYSKAGSMHDDP